MPCCRECLQWFDTMQKVGDDGVVMDAYDGWCLTHSCEVDADSEPCPMFDKRWSVEEPSSFYSDEDMVRLGDAFLHAGDRGQWLEMHALAAARFAVAVNYAVAVLWVMRSLSAPDALNIAVAVALFGFGTYWLWVASVVRRSGR